MRATPDTCTKVVNMILDAIGDEYSDSWLRLLTCRQRCMRLPGVGSKVFAECVAIAYAIEEQCDTGTGREAYSAALAD